MIQTKFGSNWSYSFRGEDLWKSLRRMTTDAKWCAIQNWNTSRSFPHSRLNTGFVTRLTRQMPLVEQELPTLPEHLSSPPIFSGVRVTRSLVLYVCIVDLCLSFFTFFFGHCVVCSSLIYEFWLPLWHLQTLLADTNVFNARCKGKKHENK
jgi:hypothetical protein